MKTLFVGLLVCLLMFSFAACSNSDGDQGAKKDDKVTVEKMPEDPPPLPGEEYASKKSEIRKEDNPIVTLHTEFGDMVLELYRDVAPTHVDSFLARTKEGYYDGTIFHRIIDNFMIQGGDPTGTGTGHADYMLPAEFSELPHQDGTLSMARSQSPNSASTQFFICLGRNRATQSLDGKYTVFGQLLTGYDVLHTIARVPVEANPANPREMSKPKDSVILVDAFVSDAEGNPK